MCIIYPDGTIDNQGLELQKNITRTLPHEKKTTIYYYSETEQHYLGTKCVYRKTGPFPGEATGTITGFGLITNGENGYPVECIPIHNSNDQKISIKAMINTLKERNYEHLTIIANKSMISEKNVQAVLDAGYNIMGTIPESNKKTWKYISRWTSNEFAEFGRTIKEPSGKRVLVQDLIGPLLGKKKVRMIVVEDYERKEEESIGRDQALKEIKCPLTFKRYNELRNQLGKLVKSKHKTNRFVIDKRQVEINSRGDGRFLLFNTDTRMGTEHMINRYYQKNIMNDIFRLNTNDVQTEPIRFQRRDRIEAYSTINYLVYLIWAAADQTLKREKPNMTLMEALTLVEDVTWIRSSNRKSDRYWITDLTGDQRDILNIFGALKTIPVSR